MSCQVSSEVSALASKYKKTPLEPHLSFTQDGNEPFVRLTSSLTASPLYLKLSFATRSLLLDIYLYVGKDYNSSFTYPEALAKKRVGLSKQTFINAKKQLIDYGFIEVVEYNRNLRKANVYKLSCNWRLELQAQGYKYDIRKRIYYRE